MPDGSTFTVEISIAELDKLLELCKGAVEGLSKASQLTRDNRQNVRDAVGNTCELIDTILTTVKQRLSDVRKAVLAGESHARQMIADLDNASEWEDNYRRFHLSEPLRNAAAEIEAGILGRFVGFFSFKNPNELKATINVFLGAEAAAGLFVITGCKF